MDDRLIPREAELATPVPPAAAALTGLAVFQGISAAAGIIAALKSIFENHGEINEQLDEILTKLQQLQQQIIRATADILEAIDGLRREINEKTARDNIALADVALFNDLAIFDDKQAAMARSFQAADRLVQEDDASFATSFMYVVNIRLAVLKEFDPNYFCVEQFIEEFRRYIARLEQWIEELNTLIARSHIVSVAEIIVITPGGTEISLGWEGRHLRNGVLVRSRRGRRGDTSESTRQRLLEEMNASRSAGITADRRQFGVVDMERTAAAWRQAFDTSRRLALVSQVLNRSGMAVDFNPDGLMVDGRVLPDGMDLRSTLFELLTSREFQRRIEGVWNGFVDGGEDRLAQFAHRRLFGRDATADEVALLRRVGTNYGYGAFVGALVYGTEYEKRWGRGLPAGGRPVLEALESVGDGEEPAERGAAGR
jgi:hypothetical protein